MLCKEEDCDRTATMRKMCDKHYQIWYRAWRKNQALSEPAPESTPLELDFDNAACIDEDPDLFFSEREDKIESYSQKNLKTVRAICGSCAIKDACLKYAVDNDLQGIWGGMTRRERIAIGRAPLPPRVFSKGFYESLARSNAAKTLEVNTKNMPIFKKALELFSEQLPAKTIELVKIRIDNPTLSAEALIHKVDYPVTRDAINATLRRVVQRVKDYEKE